MTYSQKLKAGDAFPILEATKLDGTKVKLGKPEGDTTWQAVFVYRGKHCPLCTKYLNEIETYKQAFAEAGVDILAVSADSKQQLEQHLENLDISFTS
ncbi:redoxin domain-containing protein, partial [Marinomonas communis]|uniref:redoxin domain-containing protein n=1 Tax=Marinomonas communis TaxID=28254 RepID=UPI00106193A3